jgi:hypothetical protein
MVVVFVELWKGGDPGRRVELGSATISNVSGARKPTRGDYIAHFYGKRKKHLGSCSVKGFPRKRLLGWDLVFRAARACFEKRNPKVEHGSGRLAQTLAELRHAYAQLLAAEKSPLVLDYRMFADGLIAPAIRRLEELQKDGAL